ncbi:MAG: VCBS repeat-containing protein [Candidatus Cyclobacteriaceae bacterium M3_2C_046]
MKGFLQIWSGLMIFGLIIQGCDSKKETLFELQEPGHTGIHFTNTITENDTLNILEFEYVYNGGGVGISDFNNDSLPDIYFTGNQVDNKLYLNRGNFQFEDITQSAGVDGSGRWASGIALVDINQDGWQDMYVCNTVYGRSDQRENQLYINNGPDANGEISFTEQAAAYGINDSGHSINAAFFDYDMDGDLDLYVLTNQMETNRPNQYRDKKIDGSNPNTDRLYRNNGDQTFTNVSREAGILIEGYGLGVSVHDFNLDGWPDLYITNDYLTNDLLYINNQDGTFTDQIKKYTQHQSYSAMGHDVSDINNDGFVDIFALDMLPAKNKRKRMMIGGSNYLTYIYNQEYGYSHQYIRNTLQLNAGPTPEGHPVFNEIGHLAGIYETDWSWSPLFADLDLDGDRDLLITNGFPKDVTDHDFGSYRYSTNSILDSKQDLLDMIPVVKIPNYGFENQGDLTFTNQTEAWGLSIPSFSNGAALGDLDNDGDLDYVVNNINDSAFVFENKVIEPNKENNSNYLKVRLKGTSPNQAGLGSKVSIHYDGGKKQFYEHSIYRGYISSLEDVIHFGLGNIGAIDSLQIMWPDGSYQLLTQLDANQQLVLRQSEASEPQGFGPEFLYPNLKQSVMQEVAGKHNLQLKHKEEDKIDYNVQRTLPHKFSQNGPSMAVGDINQDGLEDFFLGGAAGERGIFSLQQNDGTFVQEDRFINYEHDEKEDMGSLLFDADQDGDLDLYVVSGSYEFEPESKFYQDRLYLNDGKGYFNYKAGALPEFRVSGSCVKAADFDQDGDLDLFVGGRVKPGGYPQPVSSFILQNESGNFKDVTDQVNPDLGSLGMVNDALWTDFNQDGAFDLMVVGEWMPVTVFQNENGRFKDVTNTSGLHDFKGWWNSLAAADFDQDGDMDFIAGNWGENNNYQASDQYPLQMYAKDFDQSNYIDPILVKYAITDEGSLAPYPWHPRDELVTQLVMLKKRVKNYEAYGKATIHDLFSEEELQDALVLQANWMKTSYIENKGTDENGQVQFEIKSLPVEAQFAPVYGILPGDFDQDGHSDILLTGNNFANELFGGQYDAMKGLWLQGDGTGDFKAVPLAKSGFYVPGDGQALAQMFTRQDQRLILAGQNRDRLRVFASADQDLPVFQPLAQDAWMEVSLKNGGKIRVEFPYGSTFLSQSSRCVKIHPEMVRAEVYDYQGNKREVQLQDDEAMAVR